MQAPNAAWVRVSVLALGAVLILVGAAADFVGLGGQPDIGASQVAALVLGGLMLLGAIVSHAGFRFAIYFAFSTYVLVEAGATALYLADIVEPPDSIWAFEESGKTIQFDPIRGYRLTSQPSRFTRITHGTIEYVGELRGNNQGFPDRDDFQPERDPRFRKRFAVFGDSFTAAQYLSMNWPDRLEALTRVKGHPMQLLNFSVDGGGLGNWWSILTRIVEPDGYQVDGVIFAVIPDNLRRTFSIADDRNTPRHRFARIPSWDPAEMPKDLAEAELQLQPSPGYVVAKPEFDALLAGHWRPRSDKAIRPYLTGIVLARLSSSEQTSAQVSPAGALPLVEDILRSTRALGVPVLVVDLPLKHELLQRRPRVRANREAKDFAELMHATYLDGGRAFEDKEPDEIPAEWLPYDGHWGQRGSDHFAEFMEEFLRTWP